MLVSGFGGFLLALPAFWPFIKEGLPETVDGTHHLLRLMLFDAHIQHGSYYPRWTHELVLGYGYPVFSFYGPAIYYLGVLLHRIGLDLFNAQMWSFILLMCVACLGAAWLAYDLFEQTPKTTRAVLAAVAGLLYLYSPYLLTNVYIRGALAELAAQAWLPWLLWSWRRIVTSTTPQLAVVIAALILGGLAITHTITLLFVPPWLVIYVLVYWSKNRQHKAKLTRIGWLLIAGVSALGISCFFWLPILAERSYLSSMAYAMSDYSIDVSAWTWHNFMDWRPQFYYHLDMVNGLGVVQCGLAISGFALMKKRGREAWFLLGTVLIGCVLMSRLALPLWTRSELLMTAQFTWRLLTLITLPLVLLSVGSLTRFHKSWLVVGLGILLVGVSIWSYRPQTNQFPYWVAKHEDFGVASTPHYEQETHALGTSSVREFMPRWSSQDPMVKILPVFEAASQQEKTPLRASIQLSSADHYQLSARVASPEPFRLSLTNFYFPGWQATWNGKPIPVLPDPEKGLMEIDVPNGEGNLRIMWAGTPVQSIASWISLGTLLSLGLLAGSAYRRARQAITISLIPLGLLLFGLLATFNSSEVVSNWQEVTQPWPYQELTLLGFYGEITPNHNLNLYPYWFTRAPLPRMRMLWQVVNDRGIVVGDSASEPYFNSVHSDSWLAGAIVDDAYQIGLSSGLTSGRYEIRVGIESLANLPNQVMLVPFTPVGIVELPTLPNETYTPAQPVSVTFGNEIRLEGIDLQATYIRTHAETTGNGHLVFYPGDQVHYKLYWRPIAPVTDNFHSFIHLINGDGHRTVTKLDHLPGTMIYPPLLWNRYHSQPDLFQLTIPENVTSGVYYPKVGLYHYESLDLLQVRNSNGNDVGDSFMLPAIKIVNNAVVTPSQTLGIRIEEFATLIGYDLSPASAQVVAGDVLTLTLYYRTNTPITNDFTQFVHLYDSANGMIAQVDSLPQAGDNPTWSWIPGEVIMSSAILPISQLTQPGTYNLSVGLYDAQAAGKRARLFAGDGRELADSQALLTQVTVQ
ncbi:MAG: 6-pyruvoyl-tetrahydropterin synthase-related protein [Caldilineaceae bacterium]